MTLKEKIIKELKNEIRCNEFYKNEVIDYLKRTDKQANDLLTKLMNGEYDEILSHASKMNLGQLSTFDLTRSNNSGKPTIKDYRKYVLIEEIKKRLKYLKDKKLNEEEKNIIENRYRNFLNNLEQGIYDKLLEQQAYWFAKEINLDTLVFWDDLRSRKNNCNKITLPNYIVISIYYSIIEYINEISNYKKETGRNMYIRTSGREQTPITIEELDRLRTIENEILSNNYDWREARSIVREYYSLEMYKDHRFPHNIDRILSCFRKNKNIVFDNYETNYSCYHNVEPIIERAKQLRDKLTPENLLLFLFNREEDDITAYIRRMIVSQFDGKLLANKDYSEERIKYILNNPNEFSEKELNTFYKSIIKSKETLKELYDIAIGTLYSIDSYKGRKINILEDCIVLQKMLNCYRGIVSDYDFNSVKLPNGSRLFSIPAMDIDYAYSNYQKEYDYYCSNSSCDLEFVENCAEVIGNVVTSQIFREGNKRTAKCLFNAMMISNGFVPPIIDFTTDNQKLWHDFACNIDNYYTPAKNTIIQETIKTKEYFQTDGYFKKI